MAKSYEVIKPNYEKSPVDVINDQVEVIENPPQWSDLQDFIAEATEEVIAQMKSRNPDKVFDESELKKKCAQHCTKTCSRSIKGDKCDSFGCQGV